MKNFIRIVVSLAALIFIIGGFAAWRGWMDANTYIVLSGVFGSLASIVGLVALAGGQRLTAQDVQGVEAELVQNLADTMKSVKDYEERVSVNREEINRLEQERRQIELIVRQASLKIFMEERLRNLAIEVEKRVNADAMLCDLLLNYQEATKRVSELDGEIERSDKGELIKEILAELPSRQDHALEPIYLSVAGLRVNIRPVLNYAAEVARGVSSAVSSPLWRP